MDPKKTLPLDPAAPLVTQASSGPESMPREPLPALPAAPPEWMLRARELSNAIEYAVQCGHEPTPQLRACIERASEAWYPARLSWQDIRATVNVVERLQEQLETSPPDGEAAYLVIAQLVRRRLPANVRRIAGLSTVVAVVRDLHTESIESIARRQALVRLLGWQDMVERWAQRLTQLATES